MSLRGSETTEAILWGIENEIDTLSSVARNDEKRVTTQPLEGRKRFRVETEVKCFMTWGECGYPGRCAGRVGLE